LARPTQARHLSAEQHGVSTWRFASGA